MFTGIIQSRGKIVNKKKAGGSIKFSLKPFAKDFLNKVNVGDSISINGACMTVEKFGRNEFEFTAVKESLKKTNLGKLEPNNEVNLEKAMTLNSKLDGHFVQGHVDATGSITDIRKIKSSLEFFIEFSSGFKSNIIEAGSIAINGVSLTIAEIVKELPNKIVIKVAIIPHTFQNTNFKFLKSGDTVNIEFDMIGKYIGRILNYDKFRKAN